MPLRSGSLTNLVVASQSTTGFSVPVSGLVQAGDLIVFGGSSTSNGNESWSNTSGLTVGDTLNQTTSINQGPHATMSWMYKVATGSETTLAIATSLALFTDLECWVGCWTGRNTTTPITASAQTKTAGGATPHTYALTGVAAAAGDDLICFALAPQNAAAAWVGPTVPTGFNATGLALQTATPFGNAFMSWCDNFGGGATGTVNPKFTGVGTDNLGFVIALAQGSVTPAGPGPMARQIYVMP